MYLPCRASTCFPFIARVLSCVTLSIPKIWPPSGSPPSRSSLNRLSSSIDFCSRSLPGFSSCLCSCIHRSSSIYSIRSSSWSSCSLSSCSLSSVIDFFFCFIEFKPLGSAVASFVGSNYSADGKSMYSWPPFMPYLDIARNLVARKSSSSNLSFGYSIQSRGAPVSCFGM